MEASTTQQAGGPSERTPDFIPGWFAPRPGNPDPATREAVRVPEPGDFFPITFLRSTEMVHSPRRPQLGFCIGNARYSEMELAVPPGYWIVRDSDGELRNWRDEDFKARYIRTAQRWTPPVERDEAPAHGGPAIGVVSVGMEVRVPPKPTPPDTTDLADAAAEELMNRIGGLEERTLLSLLGRD